MIAGLSVPVLERAVGAEVDALYAVAQRLSAQVSTLEPSFLERAAEANRVTLAAYQEGAASLLQVLDASRTLADARLTYYRAVLAQRQSLFDLALAAGDEPETAQRALGASDGPERGPDRTADGWR